MRPPQSTSLLGLTPFRGIINGFIAGLIVGMLIGWFFHGLVGLAVRLGFVLVLLIPLLIVIWWFFLRRPPARRPNGDADGGVQVFTWSSGQGARRTRIEPEPPVADAPRARRDDDVIDIEFEELKRQVNDGERGR